eukprot:TRINITY_DN708_c0_g1_i3.p2 TRINITY_DN708_c0_g1~~TRINITY_DN708_c0_g1_i3.p2  ORF type:complete len:157 (+),score=12.82 TRINITY_DN708_c0_g1_i3:802-1272(+)
MIDQRLGNNFVELMSCIHGQYQARIYISLLFIRTCQFLPTQQLSSIIKPGIMFKVVVLVLSIQLLFVGLVCEMHGDHGTMMMKSPEIEIEIDPMEAHDMEEQYEIQIFFEEGPNEETIVDVNFGIFGLAQTDVSLLPEPSTTYVDDSEPMTETMGP